MRIQSRPGGLRIRRFPESNYHAVYFNGKTLRTAIDPGAAMSPPPHPEFWDVKITGECHGHCGWCYQSSGPDGSHAAGIVDKARGFFGGMSENERPFQVAIGGGEPTLHPDLPEFMREMALLGITPNYTTNGMSLTDRVLEATLECCGGVAVSTHPHLDGYWREAIMALAGLRESRPDMNVDVHVIISDRDSVERFSSLHEELAGTVDFMVLLPLMPRGRASSSPPPDFDALTEAVARIVERGDGGESVLAFGATAYDWLMSDRVRGMLNMSLYEPEMFSRYLDMSDMGQYPSSFEPGACGGGS